MIETVLRFGTTLGVVVFLACIALIFYGFARKPRIRCKHCGATNNGPVFHHHLDCPIAVFARGIQ